MERGRIEAMRYAGPRVRRPSERVIADRVAERPLQPLAHLHRAVGNAQVARLVAQREDVPEEEEIQAKHDRTLARWTGGSVAEREPFPEVGLAGGRVSDGLASRIEAQRGGGGSLDDGARTTMEGAFGTSFADVRVHTGGEAESLSHGISAQAFTTGSDIFFGRGASPADSGLLAHELSHVVQQRGMGGGGPMTVSAADDTNERAADAASAAVVSGAAARSAQRLATAEEG